MNPRLKLIAHLADAQWEDSSHHVCDSSRAGSPTFSESSVEDEAALLLSIAGICDREVKKTGFDSIFEEMPRFPFLSGPESTLEAFSHLKPRSEPMFREPKHTTRNEGIRARSVSIDSPGLEAMETDRVASPIALPDAEASSSGAVLVSPVTPHPTVRRLPLRKQSLRLAKQARPETPSEEEEEEEMEEKPLASPVSSKDKKGRTLQANPPKGVSVKMIGRKKFSWKCYPELEQFLIANREEYLRHSALNYTVQQKQYNNSLTDELLDLATRHGYLFDTQEFSFVTVRDRIRCYYKSYVQSAKKRGVLMGYAARKAGLLKEDDLSGAARIVTSI